MPKIIGFNDIALYPFDPQDISVVAYCHRCISIVALFYPFNGSNLGPPSTLGVQT